MKLTLSTRSTFPEDVGPWLLWGHQVSPESFQSDACQSDLGHMYAALEGILSTFQDTDEQRDRAVIFVSSKEMGEYMQEKLHVDFPSPLVGMECVEVEWTSDSPRLKLERRRDIEDPYGVLHSIITSDWDNDVLELAPVEHCILCTRLAPHEADELSHRIIELASQGQILKVIDLAGNEALFKPLRYVLETPSPSEQAIVMDSYESSAEHFAVSAPMMREEAISESMDAWLAAHTGEDTFEAQMSREQSHPTQGSSERSSPYRSLHFEWTGPFYLEELTAFDQFPLDTGLFQIYGAHPVYGDNVLLEVGAAVEQSICQTIAEKAWNRHPNAQTIHFFVGRQVVEGPEEPDAFEWIKRAAELCILAHVPAYNQLSEVTTERSILRQIHILNWGDFRSLMPEFTGRRWA